MIQVMFCPECRAEYRPGFTRCSDCDADLVHEIPEQDTRVPKRKHDSATTFPTFRNMYREGGRTVQWWTSYRRQTGGWPWFSNRHPFHELGCDSDWGRISHLVDRRTPFVALAILWNFSARAASVHHSRELGKKESEIELSAKQQKAKLTLLIILRLGHFFFRRGG